MNEETRLKIAQQREEVRKALFGYRNLLNNFLADPLLSLNEREHLKVSVTQVESAQRVLWVEN